LAGTGKVKYEKKVLIWKRSRGTACRDGDEDCRFHTKKREKGKTLRVDSSAPKKRKEEASQKQKWEIGGKLRVLNEG